ncbi:MAG TPA: DUF86 domain-containing protein [Methanoregulaceae archaeon]|nr:DUF86 domain-containing protein [Methanoregulaceae archaeon]
MRYDRERIARVLLDIDRYLEDLHLLAISTEEDLEDRRNYYALSMVLFSLLDATIDLADEIVAARDLGMPSTYREIFAMLYRGTIIEKDLFDAMSVLVSYRNRLAHEYGQITPADLLKILAMTGDIRRFTVTAKALVRADPSAGFP